MPKETIKDAKDQDGREMQVFFAPPLEVVDVDEQPSTNLYQLINDNLRERLPNAETYDNFAVFMKAIRSKKRKH